MVANSSKTYRLEKDDWTYDWEIGDAWVNLWRWHKNRRSDKEIEHFNLKNDDIAVNKALELARKINAGDPIESPLPNDKGIKSVFL